MGYGFRKVLMVQKVQASKLKPHLWNNEDLWKKMGPFSSGTIPAANILFQLRQIKQWTLQTFWAAFLGRPGLTITSEA